MLSLPHNHSRAKFLRHIDEAGFLLPLHIYVNNTPRLLSSLIREWVDDTFTLRDLVAQSDSLRLKMRRLFYKYRETSLEEREEIRNP